MRAALLYHAPVPGAASPTSPNFAFLQQHDPLLVALGAQAEYDKFRFGNAVQRLNVEHVRQLVVPLAPFHEQAVIVERAQQVLATIQPKLIDELRAAIRGLDQAMLAKAFRGELVEQDPNDEPASVLLDRIRRERVGGNKGAPSAPRKSIRSG